MRLAFIGYGNMSSALIGGILSSKKFNPSDEIYIFHNKKNSDFNLEKCKFLESGTQVNDSFEIIFLCVKPQDIETAINENINIFRDDQTVISVAAGVTVGTIKKLLRNNSSVIRAMPNLCAVYNESITGICMEDESRSERKGIVEEIFRGIGHVRKIDENEMHDFTALFGSGPAYLIYFYEALLDCGKFKNISNEDKSMLLIHLLNSTSKMLFVTKDVKNLRHSISSKGGTTEAAIKLLEDKNFKEIIAEALEVAMKRSKDISK